MARTKSKHRTSKQRSNLLRGRTRRRSGSATERQRALAQNFFKCPKMVRTVVRASSIGAADRVLDIGAGSGMLTRELAAVAGHVTAIERDPAWAAQLRRQFEAVEHVQVIEADFLRTKLPGTAYKVFANIPFNETANIVRKLLYGKRAPCTAYLVMQAEAAQKFAGTLHETQFSTQLKPWFEFRIAHRFRRRDFSPAPAVNVVLLCVQKRDPPWLAPHEGAAYRRFVRQGYRGHRACLRLTYKNLFSYGQWKRLARNLDFQRDVTPTQLTATQWVGLYQFLQDQRV